MRQLRKPRPDPSLDMQGQALDTPPWETGDPGMSPAPDFDTVKADMAAAREGNEGGDLDNFIGGAARQDLGYEPQAEPAPVPAAAPPKPSEPDLPLGADRPKPWQLALRGGARAVAGLALAGAAPKGYDGRGLNQNSAQIGQLGDQYFQGVTDYDNKVAALKRKRQEQNAAQALADKKSQVESDRYKADQDRLDRRDTRFDNKAALEAEQADPDSPSNKRKRELESEQADQGETRAEKLAKYRNSLPYKGPAVIGAFPGAQPSDSDDLLSTLSEQFGGEDKIPPAIKTRARLVNSVKNPSKRAEAETKLLTDVQGQSNKDRTSDRQAAGTETKERIAYQNKRDKLLGYANAVEGLDSSLREAGIDSENYKGEDIPGVGPLDNIEAGGLTNFFRSDKGQSIRGNALNLTGERMKELTGLAATDAERQRLAEIGGMTPGSGERRFIENVKWLKKYISSKINELDSTFKGAAEEVAGNRTIAAPLEQAQIPSAQPNAKPAREGHVKIRNKQTGQTGDFPAGKPIPDGYEAI